jgi:Histone H1-like nucleoprotein HC2
VAPDPVRDEAERLVAAAIAAVSVAARSLSGGGRPSFATGTPECCVCPVCRVIAAMREPSPELSERLATGAGDLAAGVTSLLRSFAPRGGYDPEPGEGDEFWESLRRHARPGSADPWHAATNASEQTGPAANAGGPARPKPMAKKAVVKKTVAKRTVAETTAAETLAAETTAAGKPVAKKAMAKKAMAKKAVAKRTVAETTVAETPVAETTVVESPVAKKPVAKKPVAKKAVAKRTAGGRAFS